MGFTVGSRKREGPAGIRLCCGRSDTMRVRGRAAPSSTIRRGHCSPIDGIRQVRSFTRLPLLLTGIVLLPACSCWHPTPLRPETAPVIDDRKPVRVKPRNGSAELLWHPRVVGDSLIGEVGYPPMRSAYAIRDLERMDELGFSHVRAGVRTGERERIRPLTASASAFYSVPPESSCERPP